MATAANFARVQTTVYPKWEASFKEVLGADIPIEVKWDTMMSDDQSDKDAYFDWYNKVYFQPLMTAFKNVCSDNMGKDAVKASVKKIVVDGSDGWSPQSSKFEDGVLTILHKFNTNVDNIEDRAKGWQKMLEDKL